MKAVAVLAAAWLAVARAAADTPATGSTAFGPAAPAAEAGPGALAAVGALAGWLARGRATLGGVNAYTALFHKQERIDGTLGPETVAELKFRRPFAVYLKWLTAPLKGNEAIYVEGWNRNRLRAHRGGFWNLLSVNLDPRGRTAMRGHRHPITEAGLEHLLGLLADNAGRAAAAGELAADDRGDDLVYGRPTRHYDVRFPRDPAREYYAFRAAVQFDAETAVPLFVQIFDRDDQLIEAYGYERLVLNAPLTDLDFDPRNPAYKF